MLSSLYNAQGRIVYHLEWTPQRAWSRPQLENLLTAHRSEWGVAASVSTNRFLNFLTTEQILTRYDLDFPQSVTRYCREPCSPLALALSLRLDSYLCHHTASYLHGLTPVLPPVVYVNSEQNNDGKTGSGLRQESVDAVFQRGPRLTNNRAAYQDRELCQLNGKYTARFGVIECLHPHHGPLRLTGLERTLVDLAVRPCHAGGTNEVLRAYMAAASRVSIELLTDTLAALDFTYPYHQAIGFYLERARYPKEAIDQLRAQPMEIDFYLDYAMPDPVYSSHWRLYYPRELASLDSKQQ